MLSKDYKMNIVDSASKVLLHLHFLVLVSVSLIGTGCGVVVLGCGGFVVLSASPYAAQIRLSGEEQRKRK